MLANEIFFASFIVSHQIWAIARFGGETSSNWIESEGTATICDFISFPSMVHRILTRAVTGAVILLR